MKKKTTTSDIDKLRENLMNIGDSVVCIGDLELVKVHVHTNQPNLAIGNALELGEIININQQFIEISIIGEIINNNLDKIDKENIWLIY